MLPLFPFIAGATLGAAGTLFLNNKKTHKKLQESKEYIQDKLHEGKENIAAIGECVKEKTKNQKNTTKDAKDESNPLV